MSESSFSLRDLQRARCSIYRKIAPIRCGRGKRTPRTKSSPPPREAGLGAPHLRCSENTEEASRAQALRSAFARLARPARDTSDSPSPVESPRPLPDMCGRGFLLTPNAVDLPDRQRRSSSRPSRQRRLLEAINRMPAECRNGHQLRAPADYVPGEGCRHCRRDRQRRYMRECRQARRKLRELQAVLAA